MKHLFRFSFALLFALCLTLPLAAQVGFGSVSLGTTTSATVTLTLPTSATIGSIQVLTQGAPDLDYTLASGGSCITGNSYAAKSTCTVEAEFTPRYPGTRSGAVVLFDNSDKVVATVYLEGIGSGPQTTFSGGSGQLIANNLFLPYILLDENGNLYISSGGIIKETPSASGYTQSTLSLNGRSGPLAIDGAGNFYVQAAGILYKETKTSSGYVESTIGEGLSQQSVSTLAVDGSGNLYLVTYTGTAGIEIVMEAPKPGGYAPSVLFDGAVNCNGSGLYSCSSWLAVDPSGNVYVTLNNQVLELSPAAGSYTPKWIVAGLSYPANIAVDAIGNLFIADAGNSRVVKETPWNGSYIQTVVPSPPLSYLTQVAVDQTGNIFIVDSYPNPDNNLLIQQVLKENYSAPSGVTFAATAPGVVSSDSPRTVVVTNDGTAALNFSSVRYSSDFPETPQVPGACTSSTSLPSGSNCVLTINFKPESLPANDVNPFGMRAEVAIVTNTLGSPETTQGIPVSGKEIRAANTVYISSTPNPSRAGTRVEVVADVAAAAAGPVPTGSVTFFSGATTLATVPLTGGVASFFTSALPKGTDTLSATYSGDSVYTAAKSNSVAQVVGLSIPTLILSSSTSTSFVGTPIQFTAVVAGVPNNPTPTGTVTFLNGATNLGSAPLVSGAATLPISFSAAGTQTVTASYSGDSNYVPASSLNGVDATLTLAQFFGSAPPLTAGSTTPVTVTFPSVATLTGISVLTLGIANRDFTKATGGTCSVGTVYAQGATCTVKVAFNPTHAGIHSGAVAVMDSTSSTTVIATVYLQGTLDGPQLAFSSNPFNTLGSVPIFPTTALTTPAPGGVAIDASGNLFVASVSSGYGVTKWTRINGGYQQTNLTPSGGPGIAIDGGGNLFVACGASLCKLSLQPNGSYSQSIAITGFKSLYGVAIDGAGNLYLTDSTTNDVYKETLQPNGTYLQSAIGTDWQSPNGLALDGSGDIAVAGLSSSVVEETLSGEHYSQSTVSSSIYRPVSVTFDPSGTLFVAGDTYWYDQGDGCSSASLPPVGGQGLWQETRESGNSWLQTMIYTGSSEEVILNDNSTGNLYLVDTGLTPNTCFGVWGELYLRSAAPAAPLGFGSVLFGAPGSPQAVSVYNQGNQPLKFSSIHFPTDFPEKPGVATECKAGAPLPPAATCTLTAVFQPATPLRNGALYLPFNESITITTNSLTAPQESISLTGTEIAPSTASPVFSLPGGTYPSAQTLTLTDATPGAAIYYTTNGTTPTTASKRYAGPIPVTTIGSISAFAVASGDYASPVVTASYLIQMPAATPTFSYPSGNYSTQFTLVISDKTPKATIYYTLNGATPIPGKAAIYSGPVNIRQSETVKAVAAALPDFTVSAAASATYTFAAAAPQFSPPAGTYAASQQVTISSKTPTATIFYTTNGSAPTSSSSKYTGPITVAKSGQLRAIALETGFTPSPVVSASYTIQ